MKKAIITIHGMGEQAAGYSIEFEEMLRTMFESITINSPLTDKFKSETLNGKINILKIDTTYLQSIISKLNDNDKLLIHFWSSINDTLASELLNFKSINSSPNFTKILICCDVSSKSQIELVQKYLNSIGITDKTYIVKFTTSDLSDLFHRIKNFTDLKIIMKFIEQDASFDIPYTYIIDKNRKLLYKGVKIPIIDDNSKIR
ncbi:MAG TPA: hypothetical protein PLE30_11305 [Candidatus Kapabacteria bacterium]|nr:hypothetical protein [Candidatus Kapabacteria bacterium]